VFNLQFAASLDSGVTGIRQEYIFECRLQPQHTTGRYWPGYSAGLLPLITPSVAGLPPLNPTSISTPFHNSKVRLLRHFSLICSCRLNVNVTVKIRFRNLQE